MTNSLSRCALIAGALACTFAAPTAKAAPPAPKTHTLDDYRHFRAAAIDLLGRMPTRDEIAAFEQPSFDFDRWIDQHLSGPAYVERLTRIYMDQLRLEPNVNFSAAPSQLQRHTILGPDGNKVDVFYRPAQRRQPEAIDGSFCFTTDESPPLPAPNAVTPLPSKKVTQKLLDERTVKVKPWWLYRDYRDGHPTLRYQQGWAINEPEYKPVTSLLNDPDGKPTVEVRVCREEAQTAAQGHVYASGRKTGPPAPKPKQEKKETKAAAEMGKPPPKHVSPLDKAFATQHKGEPIACDTKTALEASVDCGCGTGLERCMPGDGDNNNQAGAAFEFPNHMPLGTGMPLDDQRQQAQRWFPFWWSREVVRFLGYLFEQDRDFREILTGKETLVNGPLAQFYKSVQRGNCCGPEASFGMTEELDPLFDPKAVPDLLPHDVANWTLVPNRGPHAAGILTMPMFLEKYASARARGAAVYNSFLCKSFIAENVQLMPSSENNLMVRPGCSTCHATLEPLAAYFARVEPGSFVFLPQANLPAVNPACKKDKNGKLNGPCSQLYDVAFADDKGATLRSAYGSIAHADATPVGAAEEITKMPEFASCAVSRVASSFLGRPTNTDDDKLLDEVGKAFTSSGFRMRALVRALLRSPAYRAANNTRGAK